ncbi:sn1-specific diacylglycerol lipase beta, partial [Exaiptasia diaphana]|uniref:Uncharacterized protein n=1 Tax=Exaiptasia diaphana TaxID=2652724 RepID=A0A913YP63_EXADI
MRDTLTDMTGHGERIDIHVEGLEDGSMAHKGMFLTAQYIKDQLINKGILQGAFDEAQRRVNSIYFIVMVSKGGWKSWEDVRKAV